MSTPKVTPRGGVVRYERNPGSVCYICSDQIGMGNHFVFETDAPKGASQRMRHPKCIGMPAPMPKAKAKPGTTVGLDASTLELLKKLTDNVNANTEFLGKSLKAINASLTDMEAKLESQQPVQVVLPNGVKTKPVTGAHPTFEVALQALLADNLYMSGAQATGKSTLAQHLADSLGADMYRLTPMTPASQKFEFFGFDRPDGSYSGSALEDCLTSTGKRVLYIEEMDAGGPDIQVAFHAILDAVRAKKTDVIWLTAKHAVKIAEPEGLYVIATGNTEGFGATKNHLGRRPMDSATASRFAFVYIDYVEELEFNIAKANAPNCNGDAVQWARYVQETRSIAKQEYPQLVPCTRAIERGARLLEGGTFSLKTRKSAWELACIALYRGGRAEEMQSIHRRAWEALVAKEAK